MSTDARAAAAAYYEHSYRSFAKDVEDLRSNPQGVVVLTPRLVVLMMPALSYDPDSWRNLRVSPPGADAWYVHLMAGDVSLALHAAHVLPPLRWLCFIRGRRNNHVHRLPWPGMPARRGC